MVSVEFNGPILVAAAAFGAVWIHRDARRRTMDTVDMQAVGFFIALVLLSALGGLVVFVFYL